MDKSKPKIIPNFEQTPLSLARLSGGCTIEGKYYITIYAPTKEAGAVKSALLRQDCVREFNRLKKEGLSFAEICLQIEAEKE